jgi:hypothetical protein
MATTTVLAVISGALAVIQALPYLRSTIQGRTKPSRVACGIGVVCNICLVSSMLISGNTNGIVLPVVFLVTGLLTLALSIKYGIGGLTRMDIIAASVAAAAIAAWFILGTEGAVIGTNTAQATALIATFNKLRKNPGTEDLVSWSIGGVAALTSLIAVPVSGVYTMATMVLPVRCVLSCLVILTLAFVQYRRNHAQVAAHALRLPSLPNLHLPFAKHHHFDLAA